MALSSAMAQNIPRGESAVLSEECSLIKGLCNNYLEGWGEGELENGWAPKLSHTPLSLIKN